MFTRAGWSEYDGARCLSPRFRFGVLMPHAAGATEFSLAPPRPPDTYLGVAYAMIGGVRDLSAANPCSLMALALVSSHVLECALKAYLSRDGDDRRVRKADVRHNLVRLWELSVAEGLGIEPNPPSWVVMLSRIHDKPFFLRYSTGVHGISLPGAQPMASKLSDVIDAVAASLR